MQHRKAPSADERRMLARQVVFERDDAPRVAVADPTFEGRDLGEESRERVRTGRRAERVLEGRIARVEVSGEVRGDAGNEARTGLW